MRRRLDAAPELVDDLGPIRRERVERYLANLERLLGGGEDGRRRATVALTMLVGSIVLRAVDDEELSEEILRDVRGALENPQPAT